MEQYSNISGNSGIAGYEVSQDGITVIFVNGQSYTWTNESAGNGTVDQMKELAKSGSGLNSFINSNAKYSYI